MGIVVFAIFVSFGVHHWWEWLSLALLGIGLALDAYRIYPYQIFATTESLELTDSQQENAIPFSVISANIRQKNDKFSKLLEVVEDQNPDVLLLIEVNGEWEKKLKTLKKNYKHQLKEIRDNTYGMLLFSKFPLVAATKKFLVDDDVVSFFARVDVGGGNLVQLVCLHPRPPRPKEGPSDQRDSELMIASQRIENSNHPVLVMGDLNDVAWSHSTRLFLRTSGTLDPRKGRGLYNTFPSPLSCLGFPLDHFFHTPELFISNFMKLSSIGSDHVPLFAKFFLKPGLSRTQSSQNKPIDGDFKERRELEAKAGEWDGPNEYVNGED